MNFEFLFFRRCALIATTTVCVVWASGTLANGYQATQLGTLGGAGSYAAGINNLGQVVGGANTASGVQHAFLYTPGLGMLDIGTLGGLSSVATAINDLGQVVGNSLTANGDQHAFLYSSSTGMQDLGTLGGTQSSANAINNLGQIVGSSNTNIGVQHAFLYTPSAASMQDIGTIGDFYSYATGINDSGQVVGSWGVQDLSGTVNSHTFLYSAANGMQDIALMTGSAITYAYGINSKGQIVGFAADHGQGFIYTPGLGTQLLGPGGFNSYVTYWARGINRFGQVVGYLNPWYNPNFEWFIYTAIDGVSQPGSAGYSVSSFQPTAINDLGQIVGTGTDPTTSNSVAYVMNPYVQLATVEVAAGWNLLGSMDTISVASYFGNANNIVTVWKWLSASSGWAFYAPGQSDGGAAYAAAKGYAFLTTINSGEGFWINASKPFTTVLPVATSGFVALMSGLPSGWSLMTVGNSKTPSAFNQSFVGGITLVGQPVVANFATLWAWDNSKSKWYFYSPSLDSNGTLVNYTNDNGYLDFSTNGMTLVPGAGFWVNKP